MNNKANKEKMEKENLITPKQAEEKDDHGKNQAAAQIRSIIEMVAALDTEDETAREDAENRIHEDPLSVEVRSGWYIPGSEDRKPEEFNILLCWGGPSCRIIGELSEHGQPEKPRLEYQDWFTAWTDYPLTEDEEAALQTYCQQFYFEE